jgi:uncharacterized cupredoxin-like copper-binding protein
VTPRRFILAAVVGAALAAVLSTPVRSLTWARSSRTIEVTMRHSRFEPSRFVVRRGETVRFVITNTDPIDHELIVGDEAVQQRHETGTEASHGAVPGEVSVPAGTVAETTYTFPRAGVVLIGCHAPGHYAYGMRGEVIVY